MNHVKPAWSGCCQPGLLSCVKYYGPGRVDSSILDNITSSWQGSPVAEKKRGFSRTFLVMVGGLLALILAAYMWGFQTAVCLELRYQAKKDPVLSRTLQRLPNSEVNPSPGMRLSQGAYVFEVPWADLDEAKSRSFENSSVFAFHSGLAVSFFGAGDGLLKMVQKQFESLDAQRVQQLFGVDATSSNFMFHRTVLAETPSQLKPWMTKREAVRASFLLLFKGTCSVGGETGLFELEENGWRGFQLDDPALRPKRVTLELYDFNDRHVEIVFHPGGSPGASLTQADINRVIRTLRRVGEAAPISERQATKGVQAEAARVSARTR